MARFEVIPAIDLLDGQVVRLEQGRREAKTVYSDDPVAFARQFEAAGARRVHVVDLNGAFDGEFGNLDLVRAICRGSSLRVELGGGIRTVEAAREAWAAGVHEVIVGTRAVEDSRFVQELFKLRPGQVIVGIDAHGGKVATRGWIRSSELDAIEFARTMEELGCRRIIYTDIATDGMLSGPNVPAMERLCRAVPALEVVASGGISRLEDFGTLRALKLPNLVGAISGRAVYDGRIDLASAVRLTTADEG
ncbi:MAG: 1-(5-phosphoribosyl)-5-[(5-phosphoribosylamino)methylideneamino]imidazole-4-carboxamide isomerase [Candidatus Sumerlaeia bacterium]|nr:1-(5-phosphoribosyl)-5-[(5-phosphoribosylamino)methylideneamino]imidazole-4-carboxamide isomerase [Candidatus Sumerlaeia bacterium]